MTDSPLGLREMQTFKKLLTIAPTMNTIEIVEIDGGKIWFIVRSTLYSPLIQ